MTTSSPPPRFSPNRLSASQAVKREEYEKAAELRDRIASIEAGQAEDLDISDDTVEDQADAST